MNWTIEEDNRLKSLKEEGQTWAEIGLTLARSPFSCRSRWRRVVRHSPRFETSRVKREYSWQEMIDVAMDMQNLRSSGRPYDEIVKRKIDTDRPFGVWITADWHIGSYGTDLKMWKEHMDQFFKVKNLGCILAGDAITNVAKHVNVIPVLEQVLHPDDQERLVIGVLDDMVDEDKLTAIALSEEHDNRGQRECGASSFANRVSELEVPMFDNRGDLVLQVGKISYLIHIVHKAQWKSMWNQLHGPGREYTMNLPGNVIICAHGHKPAISIVNLYEGMKEMSRFLELPVQIGGNVALVSCGTYERSNIWANRCFGKASEPDVHILVFYPDRFHFEVCRSFEAAEAMLS